MGVSQACELIFVGSAAVDGVGGLLVQLADLGLEIRDVGLRLRERSLGVALRCRVGAAVRTAGLGVLLCSEGVGGLRRRGRTRDREGHGGGHDWRI